jgi:hypothetical protein
MEIWRDHVQIVREEVTGCSIRRKQEAMAFLCELRALARNKYYKVKGEKTADPDRASTQA